MENRILRSLGRVAGLAGIALGIVLLIFRDFLKQKLLPAGGLESGQSFHVLLAFLILTFGIGVVGMVAWIVGKTSNPKTPISIPALSVLVVLIVVVLGAAVAVGLTNTSVATGSTEVVIAGRVEEAKTFAPIEGAMVSVAGYENASPTESNGNFYLKFRLRRSGEPVRLHVDKEGFYPEDVSVLPPQESVQILLKQKPAQ